MDNAGSSKGQLTLSLPELMGDIEEMLIENGKENENLEHQENVPETSEVEEEEEEALEEPEVERLGPVMEGGKYVCIRYRFLGVDFDFPYVNESDNKVGLQYSKPIVVISPRLMPCKVMGVEEGKNPKVPQYLTIESRVNNVMWIKERFKIPDDHEVICPGKDGRINTPPSSGVTVYLSHLRAGLRFPLHPLFVDICVFFGIQLGQMAPNVIRSTTNLIICCRAMGVEVSLELWRRLFFLSQKSGTVEGRCFFFITRRPNQRYAYNNNPSSVHEWKEEYFYVKSKILGECGICVDWCMEKKADNIQPDVAKGNYLQVEETLKKYYWNLLLGPTWPDFMMRFSGLEPGQELNIQMLRKGSVANMLKRTGKKRDRRTFNANIKATITDAVPAVAPVESLATTVPGAVEEPKVPKVVQKEQVGESSSAPRKRKAHNVVVIDKAAEDGQGESGGAIFQPTWALKVGEKVTTPKQAEEFLYKGIPPENKAEMEELTEATLGNNYLMHHFQTMTHGVELLQRIGKLMRTNRSLRAAKEEAEKKKTELQESVTQLEKELEGAKTKMQKAEKTVIELQKQNEEEKKAHEKDRKSLEAWKKEADRLHQRYEDAEGKINTATVRAVLTDALKDPSFGWMFDRLARPIAGETALELEKMVQNEDPTFELPPAFQRLAEEVNDATYPWQGGEFDLDELLAPPSEDEGEQGDENVAERNGDAVQVMDVDQENHQIETAASVSEQAET